MQQALLPLFDQLLQTYPELSLISIHLESNPTVCIASRSRSSSKGNSSSPSSPEIQARRLTGNKEDTNNQGTGQLPPALEQQQQYIDSNAGIEEGTMIMMDKEMKRSSRQNQIGSVDGQHPNILWQLAELGITADLFSKLGLGNLKMICSCNGNNNVMLVRMDSLVLVFIGSTHLELLSFKNEVVPIFQNVLEPLISNESQKKN